jgi:serine protease inhibitor
METTPSMIPIYTVEYSYSWLFDNWKVLEHTINGITCYYAANLSNATKFAEQFKDIETVQKWQRNATPQPIIPIYPPENS